MKIYRMPVNFFHSRERVQFYFAFSFQTSSFVICFVSFLQISQWMSDKRYMRLSPKDVAARLNLISRVCGLDEVENYFSNIPRQLKRFEVYTSLLSCYARQKSVEIAEAVMQQLRHKWSLKTPLCYNILMNLYYQTEQHEKVDTLISEIEEKGRPFDQYTVSAFS